MKPIRAILFGALLWVFIFFEVSLLMFGLQLSGTLYQVIHYILLIILTAIVALLYFRKAKTGFGEGLLVGLVMLVSGLVLDLIITVPFFVKDYAVFFSDYLMILGLVIGVIVVGIVGLIRKR